MSQQEGPGSNTGWALWRPKTCFKGCLVTLFPGCAWDCECVPLQLVTCYGWMDGSTQYYPSNQDYVITHHVHLLCRLAPAIDCNPSLTLHPGCRSLYLTWKVSGSVSPVQNFRLIGFRFFLWSWDYLRPKLESGCKVLLVHFSKTWVQ